MGRLVFAIGGLATLGLALLGSDRGGSTDGVTTSFIVEKTFAGSAVACSSPSADDGAFALMGHKISAGGMTYATNPATFPSNLTVSEWLFEHYLAFGIHLVWEAICLAGL